MAPSPRRQTGLDLFTNTFRKSKQPSPLRIVKDPASVRKLSSNAGQSAVTTTSAVAENDEAKDSPRRALTVTNPDNDTRCEFELAQLPGYVSEYKGMDKGKGKAPLPNVNPTGMHIDGSMSVESILELCTDESKLCQLLDYRI